MAEKEGDLSYRGKKFKQPIFYGCLIPTFYAFQDMVDRNIPGTIQHPVLKKWMYLPLQYEDYDTSIGLLVGFIKAQVEWIGIPPKA
ncbi:MAG: hypothetical protein AB8E15_06255 [Bdellovibrionales bacterium]